MKQFGGVELGFNWYILMVVGGLGVVVRGAFALGQVVFKSQLEWKHGPGSLELSLSFSNLGDGSWK